MKYRHLHLPPFCIILINFYRLCVLHCPTYSTWLNNTELHIPPDCKCLYSLDQCGLPALTFHICVTYFYNIIVNIDLDLSPLGITLTYFYHLFV